MNSVVVTGVCLGTCALLGMVAPAFVRGRKYKVAIEFAGETVKQQQSVLNNVENLIQAFGPETPIVIIAHGEGLDLLHRPSAEIGERVKQLASATVIFMACENTMRRRNISKADLIPEAVTVDSGVAEVVRRQEGGWNYIKSG